MKISDENQNQSWQLVILFVGNSVVINIPKKDVSQWRVFLDKAMEIKETGKFSTVDVTLENDVLYRFHNDRLIGYYSQPRPVVGLSSVTESLDKVLREEVNRMGLNEPWRQSLGEEE